MSGKPNDGLDDIIDNLTQNLMKKKKITDKSDEIRPPKNIKQPHDDEQDDDLIDGINYYKIIGVTPQDTQEHINRKCNEKLAQYHPDKIKLKLDKCSSAEKVKQKKKHELQYHLIRDAVKMLKNPENRKYYDLQKKSNNMNHKHEFEKFKELENIEINDETRKLKELEFIEKSKELDKKHKYDSTKQDCKLADKDIMQRISDLQLERTQQETEYTHKNMFEYGNFDNTQFNKKFEAMKETKNNNQKKNNDKTIIKWDGIAAYGDNAVDDMYVSIKEDGTGYEDIYKVSKEDDPLYEAPHIESDDDSSISSDDKIDEPTPAEDKKNIEELRMLMINKRINDDTEFKNIPVNEWGNLDKNPFNSFNQIKDIISNTESIDYMKNLHDPDIKEAIKELLYHE